MPAIDSVCRIHLALKAFLPTPVFIIIPPLNILWHSSVKSCHYMILQPSWSFPSKWDPCISAIIFARRAFFGWFWGLAPGVWHRFGHGWVGWVREQPPLSVEVLLVRGLWETCFSSVEHGLRLMMFFPWLRSEIRNRKISTQDSAKHHYRSIWFFWNCFLFAQINN